MLLTDLLIAVRNLLQHTKRTIFLGAALAAVTALLVLLNALTTGIRETMLISGTTLMTGHVNVAGFYKPSSGTVVPLVIDFEKVLDQVKKDVPELDYWVQRGRGYAKAVSDSQAMDLVLGGIDVAREKGFRKVVTILSGSLDELKQPNTILIFEEQVKRLNVKVGDSLTLSAPTSRGMYNTVDVRVAAIGKNIGILSAFNAYIPDETLLRLYRLKPGSTGALQLYLKHEPDSAKVAARLRRTLANGGYRVLPFDPDPYWKKMMLKLNREDWVGQKLDVNTWEDELDFMKWALSGLDALKALLMFILIAIVLIGVMSTMWIAIRERTREIGTLRAIGMHRRKVLWLFLLEALMLGVLGSCSGALLGTALARLLNRAHLKVPEAMQMVTMSDSLTLSVHFTAVLVGVVFITLLAGLAALGPSIRAARLKPVTAMHHFG
jgi:ABC-type lipoprotein release transport system permease subunit